MPTPYNNWVAACARFASSGEARRLWGAAPATRERYAKQAIPWERVGEPRHQVELLPWWRLREEGETHVPTKRTLVLLFASLTVLTGCPQETAIWLAPGATVSAPEFLLGKRWGEQEAVGIGFVRVDPCSSLRTGRFPSLKESSWAIEAERGDVMLSRLTYGSTPEGYVELVPPQPLSAGECYEVTMSGAGTLRFDVDADGRLRAVLAEG